MSVNIFSPQNPDPLADILRSTAFVSPSGRIYRLFGEETDSLTLQDMPPLPEIPPIREWTYPPETLTPEMPVSIKMPLPEESASSFDDILRQIEGIVSSVPNSIPAAEKKKRPPVPAAAVSAAEMFREIPTVFLPPQEKETGSAELPCSGLAEISEVAEVAEKTAEEFDSETTAETACFVWAECLDTLQQTAAGQIQALAGHLIGQRNQNIRKICFSGIFSGDGCTTILLCAARTLAESGYKILLIDANDRHPDLQNQFCPPLCLPQKTQEIIPVLPNLEVLCGQSHQSVSENMETVIPAAEKEGQYDFVLIDSGCLTESPFPQIAGFWHAAGADGVILISNIKRSAEFSAAGILRRFEQSGINLLGFAENCV
ncbi:MAG: hypothetical protein LBH00_12220 [Planctomycetaceae bacterium]|nr:hypothetical protein [Planctomycetaceae bacterium]